MSARISTILILGATRGIGEALARRFHAMGKKLIITGRERDEDKMQLLANEMPGLEFRVVCILVPLVFIYPLSPLLLSKCCGGTNS